jgi:hypothetical protein
MQLKLRHIILFVIACAVLMLSHLPGGALLAICALMQINLLIHGIELTKKSQLAALKLFAISIPLFFFWGGIHAFAGIYLKEQQYVLLAMSLIISFGLSFLLAIQNIFPYSYLKSHNFEVIASIQAVFNDIKSKKSDFFRITFALYVFSFIPWLKTDWKLVFAIMATHLFLHRNQLKKAISNF